MAKIFYSVELEANSYMDDIIKAHLRSAKSVAKKHRYTNADGRIAEITDDGDPLVTAFTRLRIESFGSHPSGCGRRCKK